MTQSDQPRCPVHGRTDCSPLLNGCSRLTAPEPAPPIRTPVEIIDEMTKRVAREFDDGYGLVIMPLDGILDRIRAEVNLPAIDYTQPL